MTITSTNLNHKEEVIVAYRPFAGMEKWFKYRFSAWSEIKAWIIISIGVLFFTLGGPGFVLRSIVYLLAGDTSATAATPIVTYINNFLLGAFFSVLFSAALITSVGFLMIPTHIELNAIGIRFMWRRKLGTFKGPLILWSNIDHICLARPTGKTSPQDFCIDFQSKNKTLLKVKLGAITTQEEKNKLLTTIENYAPKVSRDPELLEILSAPQDHSYTELWLKALSAPPKRERLTPLSSGALLQNGLYLVKEQIGVGGQGTAYVATINKELNSQPSNKHDNSFVVLKESILPVYVDVNIRKQALERFQNEASMLSRLDHPQVVKLKAYFVEDHRSYLVLEHIDGQSLKSLVESQGQLSERKTYSLALQMCAILSYLHSLIPPIVHRDFTPDNLILDANEILKVVDFNVAQQSDSTTTGTVVGKHAYIPPEQFRGKPTPQSDIYALGATLYFLLTGEDPEPISVSHPILTRSDISIHMDKIVSSATSLDVKTRYLNIEALQADLLTLPNKLGNL